MPLTSVTLMVPASATWPEACTIELDTLPLLMPIETVWPLPHSLLEEAMWTLHSPSYVFADAAVANEAAASNAMLVAMKIFRMYPMTSPFRVWMHE
jgi:hypothetical protein